jgi:hypothetical protein
MCASQIQNAALRGTFFVILKVEVFGRELERSRQFMSMKNILMPMAIFFGIRWI